MIACLYFQLKCTQGRGRAFIRAALQKKVLKHPIESLVRNDAFVRVRRNPSSDIFPLSSNIRQRVVGYLVDDDDDDDDEPKLNRTLIMI